MRSLPPPQAPEGVHIVMNDGSIIPATEYRYHGVNQGRHCYEAIFEGDPVPLDGVTRLHADMLPGFTEVSVTFITRRGRQG